MDMKVQTRNSLLTAMVCVALSSGTAWAAVPEVQVPAVQQSAPAGSAAALAEASVADVVSQEKAKEKARERARKDLSLGESKNQKEQVKEKATHEEPPSVMAAKLHSMPLYWSAMKPQEEQVKKAQPIIITASDIDAKRKAEKRNADVRNAKPAAPQAATAAPKPQAKPVKPVEPKKENLQQQKPAQVSLQVAEKPKVEAPKVSQPAAKPLPAPQVEKKPQPVEPAYRPEPAVLQGNQQPEAKPVATPQEEPRRAPIKPRPEGLFAHRRAAAAPPPPQEPDKVAVGSEKIYREEPKAPSYNQYQQNLPQQIQVERPPEYEGISDEVVRHIMAGEFAMRYQLARDASEPGVYHITRLLVQNEGLTHLQKIEYLMGFGRAINRSNLSEYQKKALIDAVIQAFDDKE